jgi:hypothetical protein
MLKKRNLIFLSLLILGVLLLTSCFLKPPVTEGILKGQVIVPEGSIQSKDLTGQALPDATVNIIDLTTRAIMATTTTDADGYYQVFVPAGGPYLLQAVKAGVKLEQITCLVEVGIEYDLGTVDCVTTAAALIAQAMMDEGDNPADINCADIVADPDFDDVLSIVCTIIQAGGDPTASALVQQAVEDFLNPPEPTSTAAVINIAAIPGVTPPVTGEIPVTTITETAQYTGTVIWAPADSPFTTTTAYTATITLTAKAGFTLMGVAADFFSVTGATTVTNMINSGVVTAVFPATAAVINIAAIPGVTPPVTGEIPVTTITETAQYTGTVIWAPADSLFAAATAYTAWIILVPKAGFALIGIAANFFTVAGATTVTNMINSSVVTAVFPATLAVIDIAEIPGVTAPIVGATTVTTITETAQYTGTVIWDPADNPFQGNKVYTATIILTPKAGFTLIGVVANFFTVAGATTNTNSADSGVVTAEFPMTATVVVGDSYGGGIVAYILQSGDPGYNASEQHGLIAATADQSTGVVWSNITTTLVGTTTAIGTGQENTTAIVLQSGCTSGAAWLCNHLTEGGYTDWYLPSKDELNKLYLNRVAIGGFVSLYYWSSSEYAANSVWYQNFNNGYQYSLIKGFPRRVRAVRAF